jgi:hypothetical protein
MNSCKIDRQTNGQKDGWTDGWMGIIMDKQTDRKSVEQASIEPRADRQAGRRVG